MSEPRPFMISTPEVSGHETSDAALPRHPPGGSAGAGIDRAPGAARGFSLALAWRLLLVAGGYFVAGKLGLALASVHPSASAIWPGTGIAIASLILFGPRVWPAIFVGAFLVNVTTAGSLLSSFGIAVGNTLEGLLAASLAQRFAHGRTAFDRAGDTFRYAGVTAIACMVSATIGVGSLALTGFAPWENAGPIWLTWWLGDVGGAFIVAPFLIVWSRPEPEATGIVRIGEAALLVALVAFMGWTVFHLVDPLAFGISLQFLFVPPLVWAAFRFGQRLETLLIVLVSVLAVSGTLGRVGVDPNTNVNSSLLTVQVFLSMMAVTKLGITALVGERRRAAQALSRSSEQLREAVTQLEAFSHAISHDLRSPIGTVLNTLVILEEDHGPQVGPEGMRLLQRIQTASYSAIRLLDQLALYAWSDPRDLAREVVDMTSLAREAYAEVASSGYEIDKVEFDLQTLPPAVGSAALIVRVFRNLLSNAVKYTRGHEPRRIQVRGLVGRTENTYLVSDNGMGFDPSERDAMFEPFRRLKGARGFEGSGIGLAVVAKIVRRHGGRVWAESDGEHGSRFGFTLRNAEDTP